MAAIREAEMLCVPLLHLLPIRGLEEDTTDAEDSALLAHDCFPRFDCTGPMLLRLQPCSALPSSSEKRIGQRSAQAPVSWSALINASRCQVIHRRRADVGCTSLHSLPFALSHSIACPTIASAASSSFLNRRPLVARPPGLIWLPPAGSSRRLPWFSTSRARPLSNASIRRSRGADTSATIWPTRFV